MLDRAAGEALLARLDAALNEIVEVRRQVAALIPPAEGNGLDASDDFADVIEISTAVKLFNRRADSDWASRDSGQQAHRT